MTKKTSREILLQDEVLYSRWVAERKQSEAFDAMVRQHARTQYLASAKELVTLKITSDVGEMVREARKSMKMTQQTFADLAGVGRRFVSELEAGKPTLEFERVLKVCQAAGIDMIAVKR